MSAQQDIHTTDTGSELRVGDPVWYAGFEHRVTAIYPGGRLRVASDRPGVPTAFTGSTSTEFVTPRQARQ